MVVAPILYAKVGVGQPVVTATKLCELVQALAAIFAEIAAWQVAITGAETMVVDTELV